MIRGGGPTTLLVGHGPLRRGTPGTMPTELVEGALPPRSQDGTSGALTRRARAGGHRDH
jgi:hypothetical protein